ncbi:quinone oxidoreductase [Sphingomonas piscis]|uniref:Quinone oxidoreductase n=1 Tax=Sphingomonas piscis TaxID=2714943 RepID=A0A6G7YPC3_9SPHN|nr:quinone oxidoreductase [Sphingomonas piscis]QIK78592.1 quinone oxidoreductase [Sphingomonas piscis]
MSGAIRLHETGGPEVLRWEEVEVGAPGPGEARIRQHAVGLNYIDVYHRMGIYPQPLPFTPGSEGAGVVDAVGDGVTEVQVGDRVAYAGPAGGYAEVRLIPAAQLVKLPETIDFETAAAIMLQGMTVHMLIRRIHELKAGETILVHAAAGGVGLILCQWAASLGATVIGTVSTEAKAALARAHGCHHPVITGEADFVAEVERITGGKKLPVVYDSVGKDTFLRSLDCLAPRGMMASFGQASGPIDPISPTLLAQKGSLFLTRPTLFHYNATRPELERAAAELFDVVKSGKVKVEIGQRFALRDVAEAHRALESRKTTGSTVLLP